MAIDPDRLNAQLRARKTRGEVMEALDITEAHAAVRCLSPTLAGFFANLCIEPLVEPGAPLTALINVEKARQHVPDSNYADTLLQELIVYDLVEETETGEPALTALGHEAHLHLYSTD